MLRISLTDAGKVGPHPADRPQIDLTQPILRIAGVLTLRILAQECSESLAGLVEVLCLDQVECGVVELLLRRITRSALRLSGRGSGCTGAARSRRFRDGAD